MKKLTAEKIERKLKAAHAKNQRLKLENALGMRWYRKLKVFKASNVEFDPINMRALSYDWWNFVLLVKGKVIFNGHRYSITTIKHQYVVRGLLKRLGIKIHAEVDMRASLTLERFKSEALVSLYEEMIQLEIAIARKGSNKQSNAYRLERIKRIQRQIKLLRSLGATFSKQREKALRDELMRDEADRLEQARASREYDKERRQLIRQTEKSLMAANEYAVL